MADRLARRMSTPMLTLYGVGVIVGAGIYVLLGKVAGVVGEGVGVAFLVAALAALPSGLSYAELASRYPRSAGEAVFADRAFGRAPVSFLIGYLVLASGVASTAAVSHGFANYASDLIAVPAWGRYLTIVVFLAVLSWVNHRGIEESAWLNAVCTVTSVGALLLLIFATLPDWGAVDVLQIKSPEGGDRSSIMALIGGAALSFYAFIGFEDMCNVAEEVRQPERSIPRAILYALGICSLIYMAIGIAVMTVASPRELAASEVPLALVAERVFPNISATWLNLVALFAVTNTALFNLIMASRVLYGMSSAGWIPGAFSYVHRRRKTPTVGVVTAFGLAAVVALTGFLRVLAEATNVIILTVFLGVNIALITIRLRRVLPDAPERRYFRVPLFVPFVGAAIAAYLASRFSLGAYVRAAALLLFGVLLYLVERVARSHRSPRDRDAASLES